MRETFPTKSAGQTIGAGHINKLSEVARRVGTPDAGSYALGKAGANANFAPFVQRTFIVVGFPEDEDTQSSSSSSASSSSQSSSNSNSSSGVAYHKRGVGMKIYGIKPLYFDAVAGKWLLDEESNTLELDAGGLQIELSTGDVLVAFWDPQRSMFIPTSSPGVGEPWIMFQPQDVCPGIGFICDCAVCEIITASCNSTLSPGDTVQVWDFNRNSFNMPENLLLNSYGLAHKYKNTLGLGDVGGSGFGGDADCIWIVSDMFCVLE